MQFRLNLVFHALTVLYSCVLATKTYLNIYIFLAYLGFVACRTANRKSRVDMFN
jgi:multisubunit Na+/H+ antiporter MnhF subunit